MTKELGINIWEEIPSLLEILLIDRTRSTSKSRKNIIWANDNYRSKGREYAATSQIRPEQVTGLMKKILRPRNLKTRAVQKLRTKQKAEVFTPTWIVKKQLDALDKNYKKDDLEVYLRRTWLEIACGEAPYITTRYDMLTGTVIALSDRVGFLDRKLALINQRIDDFVAWQDLVEIAYKATYGFEWNGDSLLIARENLLQTYYENYLAKWQKSPDERALEKIAVIISYNIFQMDGLTYTIPLSQRTEKVGGGQLSLFDDPPEPTQWIRSPGIKVKVMNWEKGKMETFEKGFMNG